MAFLTHFWPETRHAGRSGGSLRVKMPCRCPQKPLESPLERRKRPAWTFNHGRREVPETALEALPEGVAAGGQPQRLPDGNARHPAAR